MRGPWKKRPGTVDPATVRWRKGRPPDPQRTYCASCARPFDPKAWIPVDKVCADCRTEAAERAAVEAAGTPALFDLPGGGDDTA